MRISQYKIDLIANVLTNSIEDKRIELKSKAAELLYNKLISYYPKELLNVYKKYPESFHSIYTIYLPNCFYGVDISIYKLCFLKTLFSGPHDQFSKFDEKDEVFKKIKNIDTKLKQLEDSKRTLKNKIICTLTDLKTYNNIKNEFPEAYKALIDIDKKNKGLDPCTKIETLRAELNKELK